MPSGPAVTNLRGLPDIAMAADAFSGAYNIYGPNVPGVGDCSTGCAIGGTSEASPLAMGAYSRLMSGHANALGFAAPQLYHNYVQTQGAATTVQGPPPTQAYGGFHDVITGANGPYTALPGLRLHHRPGHAGRLADERPNRHLTPAHTPRVRTADRGACFDRLSMTEAPIVTLSHCHPDGVSCG